MKKSFGAIAIIVAGVALIACVVLFPQRLPLSSYRYDSPSFQLDYKEISRDPDAMKLLLASADTIALAKSVGDDVDNAPAVYRRADIQNLKFLGYLDYAKISRDPDAMKSLLASADTIVLATPVGDDVNDAPVGKSWASNQTFPFKRYHVLKTYKGAAPLDFKAEPIKYPMVVGGGGQGFTRKDGYVLYEKYEGTSHAPPFKRLESRQYALNKYPQKDVVVLLKNGVFMMEIDPSLYQPEAIKK